MLKSLTDFSDGNLPVPSLLLQEVLEQNRSAATKVHFSKPLLQAVEIPTVDPIHESSSDIWCDVYKT